MKKLKWVALIVLLLLIAGGIFVYEKTKPPAPQNYANVSPTSVLLEKNADFAAANKDEAEGDYVQAKQLYQEALANAQDSTQEAQIEYYIATVDEYTADYPDAIKLFKQIAITNPGWPIMEAYATQALVTMHFDNRTNTTINSAVFTGAPYASLLSSTTTSPIAIDDAYRKLSADVVSIYPLGVSEAHLAYWSMEDLEENLHGATTTPQGAADVTQIDHDLAAANQDIQRIKNDPVANLDIPTITTYEGMAEGYLASVGAADPQDAENDFQEAMQYMASVGAVPGQSTEVDYAAFLQNMYGQQRIADIDNLLAPFSAGNEKNIFPAAANSFLSALTDPTQSLQRGWLISLAQADPSFKTYLESIGWQASDFAQS